MAKYILALDQGTTSSRCIIYDHRGKPVITEQQEFEQIYPAPGLVEHDPAEIFSSQIEVAKSAMRNAGLSHDDIEAIGITNQRETTIVWERATGKPVYNAIVWQCRRTADFCDGLKAQGLEETIRNKTGLIIDAYFSGTKLRWILDNVPSARKKAEAGELAFGTVESWLIWNLTGGKVHTSDYTNAARTMMFNIHDLEWDDDILEILDIPKSLLPEVLPSSHIYGYTLPDFFGGEIPISGCAGDQQAALFGQRCFDAGMSKMTYGTGGFMLMNTGDEPVASKNGLLTTLACGAGGRVSYALEGSVFVAGAAVQWLRDELDIIENSAVTEEIAKSVEDTSGVYIVPAFVGLGAPYWDSRARGAIFGITRGVSRAEIVRATLESLAYQTADLIDAMQGDAGKNIPYLMVDGGASANDFLMQFQADILGEGVVRPQIIETTSLGAAFLAGLSTGYWSGTDELAKIKSEMTIFTPDMPEERRGELMSGWHRAVNACMSF